MSTKQVPISIYSESTPNPATMKFVANQLFLKGNATVEFNSPDQTEKAPLAARLFSFPFIKSVFFSGNFITITKTDAVEWIEVTNELRDYITNYLMAGYPAFENPPKETKENRPETVAETPDAHLPPPIPETEQEHQIVNILEEYIRPAVESDGGAIDFRSYKEGTLTVTLKGACSGCPSSMVTLKNGIETLFQRMMPEVKQVVAEEA